MTNTAPQAGVQVTATEPQRDVPHADVPAWKDLADDVEDAASSFSEAVEELTELLDRFEWEDDVPEDVQEAADDVSTAVYGIAAGLKDFRAAVDNADDSVA
jgi:hypothetical protein